MIGKTVTGFYESNISNQALLAFSDNTFVVFTFNGDDIVMDSRMIAIDIPLDESNFVIYPV